MVLVAEIGKISTDNGAKSGQLIRLAHPDVPSTQAPNLEAKTCNGSWSEAFLDGDAASILMLGGVRGGRNGGINWC